MGNWLKVQTFGPTSPEILEQKFEAGVTDSAFCVYFPSDFDMVFTISHHRNAVISC